VSRICGRCSMLCWDCKKKHYVARSLYYLSRLFSEQLNKGDSFDKLSRTVAISLLNYGLVPHRAELHSVYRFREQSTGDDLSDLLEVHYVELSKLYFLKFSGRYLEGVEPLPAAFIEEEGMEMAFQSMTRAYARDEVRDMIEARRKSEHDEATALKAARDDGKLEGKRETIRPRPRALAW
jgi:predicted transposase/invertase (TIGR01784 family)